MDGEEISSAGRRSHYNNLNNFYTWIALKMKWFIYNWNKKQKKYIYDTLQQAIKMERYQMNDHLNRNLNKKKTKDIFKIPPQIPKIQIGKPREKKSAKMPIKRKHEKRHSSKSKHEVKWWKKLHLRRFSLQRIKEIKTLHTTITKTPLKI